MEKRQAKAKKDRKTPEDELNALAKLEEALSANKVNVFEMPPLMRDKPARFADLTKEELQSVKSLGLLTLKKVRFHRMFPSV